MELDETARLKLDVSSFQVIVDALAKIVGDTNAFADQKRKHTIRILVSFFASYILLGGPCGGPDSIQCIPEVRQNTRVQIAREQQLMQPLKLRYGTLQARWNIGITIHRLCRHLLAWLLSG